MNPYQEGCENLQSINVSSIFGSPLVIGLGIISQPSISFYYNIGYWIMFTLLYLLYKKVNERACPVLLRLTSQSPDSLIMLEEEGSPNLGKTQEPRTSYDGRS